MIVVKWLTSKATQLIAVFGIVLLLVWRIFTAGKSAAVNERVENEIKSVKERNRIDADVEKTSDSELRHRASRWLRNDDGR